MVNGWNQCCNLNGSSFLRLFGDTLTGYGKYSLINRNILTQPIQMQLTQKQETFSAFLAEFSKSISNFELFQTKDDSHSSYLSEITDFDKRG